MPDPLHVGVTGSRNPLTTPQARALGGILAGMAATADGPLVLHHGVCQGADEAAHKIARKTGGWRIEGHPGRGSHGLSPWRAADIEADCDVLHAELLYYLRNRDINRASSALVAAPAYPESDPRSARSGTWQTVRDARARHRTILFAWADGTTGQESYCPADQGSETAP